MEDDIKNRWLIEYFLRLPTEDRLVKHLITLCPSIVNDRLMKTLLVRKISSQLQTGLISENILFILELIEELDHRKGIRILDSMKEAYFAVALDCTVKFLKENPKNYSGYANMMSRVWRGRVLDAERANDVHLVSNWTKDLISELEEAMHDASVCDYLSGEDTHGDALKLVGLFLAEVTEEMGPSFLELAANTLTRDGIDLQASVSTATVNSVSVGLEGSFNDPHNDLDEMNANVSGYNPSEIDANTSVDSPCIITNKCIPVPVPECLELTEKDKELCQDMGSSFLESATVNEKIDEIQVPIDYPIGDQVGRRQGCSVDVVGEILEGNNGSCSGDRFSRMHMDCAVESSDIAAKKFNAALTPECRKANEKCEELGQEMRPSLLHSTLEIAKENFNEIQVPTNASIDDQVGVVHGCSSDAPGEILVVTRGNSSGDAFNNIDVDCSVEKSDTRAKKCTPVLTPEFRKVQEALKSSMLDLHDVVEDPLPDALCMAATVSANLAKDGMNNVQAAENQNDVDMDRSDHSVENECEVVQAKEGNSRNLTADSRPSLMERNKTARTLEWGDDDLESTSEGSQNRPHLPTPKSMRVSPLRRKAIQNITGRRKVKRWSSLEEQTLIDAVREYGRGNWKLILDNYYEIFEERTVVDLKDKWRNMTK